MTKFDFCRSCQSTSGFFARIQNNKNRLVDRRGKARSPELAKLKLEDKEESIASKSVILRTKL
jgi:hypothetical protein